MAIIAQSTAYTRAFLMVASSDHISPLLSATVAVNLSKNGGAFAGAGGAVSEVGGSGNGSGWYIVKLTTTDTNTLGDIAYHCTAASGDNTDFSDQIGLFNTQVAGFGLNGGTVALVNTCTTVTNQLTAAQIATGVWQDTTGTDFTTSGSIGKSLFTSGSSPGASGGILIAGSNATTTFTTLQVNAGGFTAGNFQINGGNITIAAFNVSTTTIVLAKGTNITGLNDIAATSVVSAGAITTSGGAVSHVTLTDTATTVTGAVLISAGTGSGQLDFTSGVVKASLVQILGTALTETTGYLAAAFKKFFNIATPTLTTGGIDQTGDSYSIANNATFGNAKLVRSAIPGNALAVDGSGYITFNNTTIGVSGTVVLGSSQPNYAPATSAQAAAILTDVSLIGTNAGDSPNAVTAQTTIATNINATVGSRAAPGAQMDLVNAPNATAITAIQNGLATSANATTIINKTNLIATNSGDSPNTITEQGTIAKLATGIGTIISGTYPFTAAMLVNAPSGGGGYTPAQIATAIFTDTTASDYQTPNSFGYFMDGSPGVLTAASLANVAASSLPQPPPPGYGGIIYQGTVSPLPNTAIVNGFFSAFADYAMNPTFEGVGLVATGWTQFLFTVSTLSNTPSQPHGTPVFQVQVSATPQSDDGLTIGPTGTTKTDGSLVIGSVTPNTTMTVNGDAAAMALPPGRYRWEITQFNTSSPAKTLFGFGIVNIGSVIWTAPTKNS